MYCYKDMTFCTYYKDCKDACGRSLTDKVIAEAIKYEAPICQYMEKPECFKEKEKE